MLGTLTLIAAPLAALSLGCDSAEEGTPVQSPYATEQGFCDALAKAICADAVVQACYVSADATSLAEDRATCLSQASRSTVCNPDNLDYDRGGAEACIAEAKRIFADALLTADELDSHAEICAQVFNRGGGVGAPCNLDSDCDVGDGLFCVAKPDLPGSCQVPVDTAPGSKCDGAAAVCGDDYYCNVAGGSFCVERPAAGDACSELIPCQQDAYCMGTTCFSKEANGSPCTDGQECVSGYCDTGELSCLGAVQLSASSPYCDKYKP
jgi:hypothetical protein